MSSLLERALEKVITLPPDEQDAIASQILATLADEEAWKQRFVEKRDVIRRMAGEALEEDSLARRFHWPSCFDSVAGDSPVLAIVFRAARRRPKGSQASLSVFQSNPAHPGLQFKKLAGEDDIWSARISLGFVPSRRGREIASSDFG